ncbi:MAG: sialate O-acetylesterase, partial [Bacteroidia bacterium]
MKPVLFLIGLFLLAMNVRGEIKLPSLISSGMVLQRNQPLKIWGWAEINEEVTITFRHKTYFTKAGADKTWVVTIGPQLAGGPYTMQINNTKIDDLFIGDVWLCSGQSNMEAVMGRPNIKANYTRIIEESDYPKIRQFTVKRDMAFNPLS